MIAELDGAFTKYYEATLETEWRERQDLRARLVHLEPLLRQLRPGQLDGRRNDANIFIGSSNIGDGAGTPALELQLRRPARRPPPPVQDLRLLRAALERDRRRSTPSRSRASRGRRGATSPTCALTTSTSDTARYAEPAGSRRTAPHWQLDLNYTQNIQLGGRYNLQIVGDLFNVFEQADRLQLPAGGPQLGLRHAAELLRPAALPARAALPVLIGTPRHLRVGGHAASRCHFAVAELLSFAAASADSCSPTARTHFPSNKRSRAISGRVVASACRRAASIRAA